MNWQAVFFDFDGVILDSVHVKTDAFAQMFRRFGFEIERAVVDYHLANGGISRFEKFRYYYSNLLHTAISDNQLQALGEEFSKLVLAKILESPYVAGTQKTLRDLARKRIPAFVVSGTPEEEIRFIVGKRGLSEYFQEVHGSPRGKDEILWDIIGRKGFMPAQCLFIGDAMSDYRAARSAGMRFVGIVPRGVLSPFPAGITVSSSVRCDIENLEE